MDNSGGPNPDAIVELRRSRKIGRNKAGNLNVSWSILFDGWILIGTALRSVAYNNSKTHDSYPSRGNLTLPLFALLARPTGCRPIRNISNANYSNSMPSCAIRTLTKMPRGTLLCSSQSSPLQLGHRITLHHRQPHPTLGALTMPEASAQIRWAGRSSSSNSRHSRPCMGRPAPFRCRPNKLRTVCRVLLSHHGVRANRRLPRALLS
jgi:hypothetical protein